MGGKDGKEGVCATDAMEAIFIGTDMGGEMSQACSIMWRSPHKARGVFYKGRNEAEPGLLGTKLGSENHYDQRKLFDVYV